LFAEEGFDAVTFQKISERCGVTRTTLYQYFKDKREIFLKCIRQLTSALEAQIKGIAAESGLSSAEKLRATLHRIIEECGTHRKLFAVILTYLVQLKKTGKDPNEKVRRRVLRLRHRLSALVIEGQRRGEFRRVNVKDVDEMLYALVEAVIFRLAVLDHRDLSAVLAAVDTAIAGLRC
jgi:AcrR family transcriptional regulator